MTAPDSLVLNKHTNIHTDPQTDLDVSPEGVVAEILAPVFSVAGVFHFSMNEDIPWKESHLCTHVHTIQYFSHVGELRLSWKIPTHKHTP